MGCRETKIQSIIFVVGIGVDVHCYDDTVIIIRYLFDHIANETNKLNVVACLIVSEYVSRSSHVENRGDRKTQNDEDQRERERERDRDIGRMCIASMVRIIAVWNRCMHAQHLPSSQPPPNSYCMMFLFSVDTQFTLYGMAKENKDK